MSGLPGEPHPRWPGTFSAVLIVNSAVAPTPGARNRPACSLTRPPSGPGSVFHSYRLHQTFFVAVIVSLIFDHEFAFVQNDGVDPAAKAL